MFLLCENILITLVTYTLHAVVLAIKNIKTLNPIFLIQSISYRKIP